MKKHDEIDIWNSVYEENSEFINIKRIKINNITIGPDGYKFAIKFWKNLIVNEWEKKNKNN